MIVLFPYLFQNDHKISIFKTNYEMEDLQRKVENAQMRLASEIKVQHNVANIGCLQMHSIQIYTAIRGSG